MTNLLNEFSEAAKAVSSSKTHVWECVQQAYALLSVYIGNRLIIPSLCIYNQRVVERIIYGCEIHLSGTLCFGLNNLACDVPGDLQCLCCCPALSHQSLDILGSGQINTLRQFFDMNVYNFFHDLFTVDVQYGFLSIH